MARPGHGSVQSGEWATGSKNREPAIRAIPFERLVAEVTEGITVADARLPGFPLVWVNQGFLKLTGYPEESVIGHNCNFLQGPGTDPATVGVIRQALANSTPVVVELLNYRSNGTQFWNSLSLSPVIDETGSAEFFIGVQTDVTERRLREQREAEFIDNLAHELKTPLTALGIMQETLLQVHDTRRAELFARMQRQMERLSSMLDSLLALSNARSIPEKRQAEVDLGSIVLQTFELLLVLSNEKGQSLHLNAPEQPVLVLGDPAALEAVVSNLIKNAIEYTPIGGKISTALIANESVAAFEVSDTGIGIDPVHHNRIFERFYRVDPSRARLTGGAGIGLALVAEIVRRHGGDITLRSSVGEGSTFRVTLPLYKE